MELHHADASREFSIGELLLWERHHLGGHRCTEDCEPSHRMAASAGMSEASRLKEGSDKDLELSQKIKSLDLDKPRGELQQEVRSIRKQIMGMMHSGHNSECKRCADVDELDLNTSSESDLNEDDISRHIHSGNPSSVKKQEDNNTMVKLGGIKKMAAPVGGVVAARFLQSFVTRNVGASIPALGPLKGHQVVDLIAGVALSGFVAPKVKGESMKNLVGAMGVTLVGLTVADLVLSMAQPVASVAFQRIPVQPRAISGIPDGSVIRVD